MGNFFQTKRANDLISAFTAANGDQYSTTALLELADRCNETCAHCFQEQGQKGELDTAQWKKVMDDLAELGVLLLTLTGGEATLRKDFLELVEYARSKRFVVKVFTNGLSMTEALARRLAELAVHEVQISVYSHRPEVHDWITGVPRSHERTVAGIRHLRAAGVTVLIKSPLFTVNADELDAYAAFADDLDVTYAFDSKVKARETGARDPQGLSPTPEQLRRALDAVTPRPVESPRSLDQKPCGACRSVTVEANGEVRACTALTVPLGNATEEGVISAYRQGETSQFIRSLTWGDLVGCRECALMSECTRCYSDARFEGGDALAPYADACAAALINRERRLDKPVQVDGVNGEAPLGPFRAITDDHLEAFEVELTERDRRLRAEHPWIVSGPEPATPRTGAGELVQIRRPGRKKPIGGHLPLASGERS